MKKKYVLNNFRSKIIDDKMLLTNDHGGWCSIRIDQYKKLLTGNVDDEIYTKLYDNGFILTTENINNIIEKYKKKNSFLFHGTSLHIIVPTLRCNLDCVYCHASKRRSNEKGFDMDKKTAKKTVDFIFQTTSNHITIEFQGGEPLLNFDIVKYIIEYSKEKNKSINKNLRMTIVSNFTLMTEDKLKYFIDNDVDLCTSFDGPKEVHNRNRPPNSYDNVTRWMTKLKEEYEKRGIKDKGINALLTVTRYALNHPKEIIDEYVKFGIKKIHLRFLNNLGDARPVWNEISYSEKEFLEFWKKAINCIDKLNSEKKEPVIEERTFEIFDHKINKDTDPNYVDLRSPCGAVIGQMTYNYDGKVYSCDEGRMVGEDLFVVGNVNEDSYNKVTTSSHACGLVAASTNDTQACDACAYKPYCGLCPVCNYAEQGNIIAKIPETSRCKIFMEQFDHYFRLLLRDE